MSPHPPRPCAANSLRPAGRALPAGWSRSRQIDLSRPTYVVQSRRPLRRRNRLLVSSSLNPSWISQRGRRRNLFSRRATRAGLSATTGVRSNACIGRRRRQSCLCCMPIRAIQMRCTGWLAGRGGQTRALNRTFHTRLRASDATINLPQRARAWDSRLAGDIPISEKAGKIRGRVSRCLRRSIDRIDQAPASDARVARWELDLYSVVGPARWCGLPESAKVRCTSPRHHQARKQQPSYSDPTKTSLSNKAGILRSVSSTAPSVSFALISFLLRHHWVLIAFFFSFFFSPPPPPRDVVFDRGFGSGKHKHAPDTVWYSRKGKLLPRMHEPSPLA
jgi:hypothetical protein